eukprot:gnl/Spiro4/6794_TR3512_c0_g1_i1.p1 gnl/Spiro4/6794_TR3512_c0_g1~~gnl/Spiro4/6794_TR3512_c0_g1_i1.p1  ORF type:complete len:407 (+),score=83.93 gnl/Spiro4/6794_TR3512_c0_g1_i1:76-1221(+)
MLSYPSSPSREEFVLYHEFLYQTRRNNIPQNVTNHIAICAEPTKSNFNKVLIAVLLMPWLQLNRDRANGRIGIRVAYPFVAPRILLSAAVLTWSHLKQERKHCRCVLDYIAQNPDSPTVLMLRAEAEKRHGGSIRFSPTGSASSTPHSSSSPKHEHPDYSTAPPQSSSPSSFAATPNNNNSNSTTTTPDDDYANDRSRHAASALDHHHQHDASRHTDSLSHQPPSASVQSIQDEALRRERSREFESAEVPDASSRFSFAALFHTREHRRAAQAKRDAMLHHHPSTSSSTSTSTLSDRLAPAEAVSSTGRAAPDDGDDNPPDDEDDNHNDHDDRDSQRDHDRDRDHDHGPPRRKEYVSAWDSAGMARRSAELTARARAERPR